MNIVNALKKTKADLLDFIVENLQNKSDVTHTHDEYATVESVLYDWTSEIWTFTLEDGSTVTKKVVITESAQSEEWVFTLEDGSTVTKKVMVME